MRPIGAGMDTETGEALRAFASSLRKRMDVEQLILFGSRARGDHMVTSDFDVVVVSPGFAGTAFPARAASVLEAWPSPLDLEALCYTPDEWRRLKDQRGILLNAQKEGIRVA